MFLKISRAVNVIQDCESLDQIEPIWSEKEIFGKMTNFVYLLYLIMPQNFKKILRE